jgi:predicted dehydrogenase/nucleoside-diphosphate-sugar epimerase
MIETLAPSTSLRVAIIGCGAVARRCHLPALALTPELTLGALVDTNIEHAQETLAMWIEGGGTAGVGVATSVADVIDQIDAAIVCTAHASHVDISLDLLDAGKHILVEKPLATTVADATRLVARARELGLVAAVGHVRRLFPAVSWVRNVLASGVLGSIESVEWKEGSPYGWDLASPSMFRRDLAGGGVTLETGAHVFDILATWFGEDYTVACYRDNSQGGVESESRTDLQFGGVPVEIELSRLRELANQCLIHGSERELKVGVGFNTTFEIRDRSGTVIEAGPVPVIAPAVGDWAGLFAGQLRQFVQAVSDGLPPLAGADAGLLTTRVAADCYSHAGRAEGSTAWSANSLPHAARSLDGQRVAVTGATGFVGGRLVDALVTDTKAEVVAMTRTFSRLVRLSTLPQDRLRFVHLDLDDPHPRLDTPVDVFVHCAYGNVGSAEERWHTSVEGTRSALRLAKDAGARRFVHISTVSVYDTSTVESLTEQGPALQPAADDREYGAQKLAAEHVALAEADGLEVVVVQPTVIYGPAASGWTVHPLTRMATDSVLLPTGDTGICNAVYVDDVVSAIVCAMAVPEAAGQRFLISGEAAISWGRFYDAYRECVEISTSIASDAALPDWEKRTYASPSAVRIDHARRVLGYQPAYSFDRGMAVTRAWARWAGLAR